MATKRKTARKKAAKSEATETQIAVDQLIDWLENGFPEEGWSVKARKTQRAAIKKERKDGTEAHTIQAAMLAGFQEIYPGVRPGRVFQIAKGAQYSLTRPGTRVFVLEIKLGAENFYIRDEKMECICVGLDNEGRWAFDQEMFSFAVKDLAEIPLEEEISILKSWIKPEPKYDPLNDGDPVELVQDTVKIMRGMFGDRSFKLPKGLAGIVDVPDLNVGFGADGINRPRDDRPRESVNLLWWVGSFFMDKWKLTLQIPVEGHGFMYKMYIPKYRSHIEVPRSLIQKRPFRKDIWDKLQMDEYARKKVLSCAQGASSDVLNSWGLSDELTKGKGAIMLFWGAPGTGKTMCAEALAEHMERPLYVVDSSVLGTDLSEFEEGLKQIIDRAKRWKAVVLWDEAEIYLRKRGDDTEQNQRVAAVLRHLENFDGILVMTTNRPVELDHAIDSRIHLKMLFKKFANERREDIWKVTIPKKMPVVDLEAALPQLREIELNGREIKTAILNAASTAAADGLTEVPGEYLVKEALALKESADALRAAKQYGDDWADAAQLERPLPNGTNGVVPTITTPTASA